MQMTSSEFVANDNVTLSAVESKEWARVTSFTRVFQYICLALGIPGNILSATVWLRLHKKNSSAVYLAVLAINDIVFLLCDFTAIFTHYGSWLFRCVNYLWISSGLIEPLLVLGFSVERLLAVCWPLQAKIWCTSSRAKKVTVTLTAAALTFEIGVTVRVSVPVTVMVLNAAVAVQVRRAANNAAANLGVEPHHQTSTSNNSAVPTVMLVATSIVYALVFGTANIICLIQWRVSEGNVSLETKIAVRKYRDISVAVGIFVFAYNFYVYLIAGKQFRSKLGKLFCRCPRPSFSSFRSSLTVAAAVVADSA